LDFSKAFNTVSWKTLLNILEIRGFDDRWIMCIKCYFYHTLVFSELTRKGGSLSTLFKQPAAEEQ
jgi:hypothetical protein